MTEHPSLRKLLKEVVPAQVFSVSAGIVAGIILASITDRFLATRGLFVLLPILLGLSNDIDGSLSARLSTALHMGVIKPNFVYGRDLFNIIFASYILSSTAAIFGGIAAHFFSLAVGAQSAGLSKLVFISLLANFSSKILSIPTTTVFTILLYRRGIDPSSVMGPMLTSYGDIMTMGGIYVATELVGLIEKFGDSLTIGIVATILVGLLIPIYLLQKRDEMKMKPIYRIKRMVLESLPMLLIPLSWTAVGGIAISTYEELFVNNPSILLLVPPLSDLAGDFGFILSSRLSVALHMGRVLPRFREIRNLKTDLIAVLFSGFVSSVYLGLVAQISSGIIGIESIGLGKMVALSLVSIMMLVFLQIFISILVSFISFAKGLDPDNVSVPIVADVGDMGGIFFLIGFSILLGIS